MDQFSEEERKQVIKAVEGVCAHGKLAYEPISELKITIHELFLSSDPEKANYFEISTMIQDALQQAIDQAHPVLLEPIYTMLITTPEEYIGTVSSLISQNHGKILEISQDVYRAHITAKMSVRQSIEFAQEIRGATSGRVFGRTYLINLHLSQIIN